MRIAICQFSGTGNTYYVSTLIRDELKSYGHLVDILSLEKHDNPNPIIREYDMIGLGYPIYGSDIPKVVSEWLKELHNDEKRCFVFCTQMMYSGDGANYVAKKLRKKRYKVRQQEHFNMPNNLTDYRIFKPKSHMEEKEVEALKNRVKHFVYDIEHDQMHLRGRYIYSWILGLFQRLPFQRLERHLFDDPIIIEPSCILCGKCVELCPTDHFEIRDEKLLTKNNCILCYRCVNHCPVKALHTSKKGRVMMPYHGPVEGFNIKDAMMDHIDEIYR